MHNSASVKGRVHFP